MFALMYYTLIKEIESIEYLFILFPLEKINNLDKAIAYSELGVVDKRKG